MSKHRPPNLTDIVNALTRRNVIAIDRWDFRQRQQLWDYDVFSWVSVVPPPDANVDLRQAHEASISDSRTIARMAEDGIDRIPTMVLIRLSKTCHEWLLFWLVRDQDHERREQLREWLAEGEETRAELRRRATAELLRRGFDPDGELVPA
jgi:hypothetical protein